MKPFLSLENIKTAAFTTAERLFDIKFIKLSEYPKYHEEVEAYKVIDNDKIANMKIFSMMWSQRVFGILKTCSFLRDAKRILKRSSRDPKGTLKQS